MDCISIIFNNTSTKIINVAPEKHHGCHKKEVYEMEKSIIKVEGMSCEHCVKSVTKAVSALPGIREVVVNLSVGTVTVEHDSVLSPLEKIMFEIEDLGYDVIR